MRNPINRVKSHWNFEINNNSIITKYAHAYFVYNGLIKGVLEKTESILIQHFDLVNGNKEIVTQLSTLLEKNFDEFLNIDDLFDERLTNKINKLVTREKLKSLNLI
jgi:hypothetical protein